MFDVSYIEQILWNLYGRTDDMFNWTLHLGRLQTYYHWLIDPEIALALINKDDEVVTKHIAEVVSLFRPDKRLIFKLVDKGYWEEIKSEWISWFEWDEYREVVNYLINHGVKL